MDQPVTITKPYTVSVAEAAELLGVDPSTIYRHYAQAMARGHIQVFHIGTAVRVVWSSLIAYIEAEEARRKVQARQ